LLHQDNAAPHKTAITHQKLADLHFEILKHPAYSPDLAPSDYYLFPNLKERLKGRKFSSTEEATLAADGRFVTKPKEFSLDRLKNLSRVLIARGCREQVFVRGKLVRLFMG
jgi:histone-lysine N-methyltransferase SETMAR